MRKEHKFAVELVANGGDELAAYTETMGTSLPIAKRKAAAKRLRKDPAVISKFAQLTQQIDKAAILSAQDVMQRWTAIANADPSKLSRVVAYCCRYCHGENHCYQWRDESEYQAAVIASHKAKGPPIFNLGGFGYTRLRKPHAGCPKCDGLGDLSVEITPTDELQPQEKMLFQSAKFGKYGIEVEIFKPSEALKLIAQAHGMLGAGKGDPVLPPPPQTVPAIPIDPNEASQIYADFMRR